MVDYFPFLLAISSADEAKFPSLDAITKSLEEHDSEDFSAEMRTTTLADAKLYFPYQPGNIELWDSIMMVKINECFREVFQGSTAHHALPTPLPSPPPFLYSQNASNTAYRKQWSIYGARVLESLEEYLPNVLSPDSYSRFMARLSWFLSDHAEHLHHFLPIPTYSCLREVGKQLNESSAGLNEVCAH